MKVAVIGAGASGLTAIKCCHDEGLEVVCYERTDSIGGLWNYKEEKRAGQASVMKSTVINTSKEMMCYSDFPIPDSYPIFMHNSFVMKYFQQYAEQFHLTKHIKFRTEVVHVKKTKDFNTTGRWDIRIQDKVSGTTEDLVFDAVLICTGHHADVHQPNFPGLDRFRGQVIHSHDYKHPRGFEDKRVVIVGIGNSGGDAAVELSRVTSQVFLSTRRGSWVLNRVSDRGMPIDMNNTTRFFMKILDVCPSLISKVAEYRLNSRFDHKVYGLKPKHKPFAQHPMVNDDLPNRIITGSVIVKPDVETFTESGVRFDDGTFEDNIDVVFLATGYKFGFPFLDKSVIEVVNNEVSLFKYSFPPDLEQPTLAVIGFIQPLGAIMPISEMQCRLATRVFKGEVRLPEKSVLWEDIRKKKREMASRYVKTQRHTIQVDYVQFMDELARLNGNQPNLKRLLFTDPELLKKVVFGPCTPYQYRLHGPGAWPGARRAIMTQWDRTLAPLKTRTLGLEDDTQLGFLLFYIVFVAFFVFCISRFI